MWLQDPIPVADEEFILKEGKSGAGKTPMVGWTMPPPPPHLVPNRHLHLNSWNLWILPCMAKGTCRCDWVKDLETRRLSYIICMGPKCNHKHSYTREPRRSEEEIGKMTTEARGWSDWRESWAEECRHPLEARKGKEKDSPLELPKGAIPSHTLTLALWTDFVPVTSRTVRG